MFTKTLYVKGMLGIVTGLCLLPKTNHRGPAGHIKHRYTTHHMTQEHQGWLALSPPTRRPRTHMWAKGSPLRNTPSGHSSTSMRNGRERTTHASRRSSHSNPSASQPSPTSSTRPAQFITASLLKKLYDKKIPLIRQGKNVIRTAAPWQSQDTVQQDTAQQMQNPASTCAK